MDKLRTLLDLLMHYFKDYKEVGVGDELPRGVKSISDLDNRAVYMSKRYLKVKSRFNKAWRK